MDIAVRILWNVLEEGLLYGVMAMGVYITYKILDFPDLSVDGTFPLGCCVTAALMTAGVSPILALLAAILAGFLAGCVTGLLHVKLGISDLLSGIIVMTGLWSVNLLITNGRAVVAFYNLPTIFTINAPRQVFLILLIVAVIVKLALDFFFRTRSGMLLKATGDNESYVIGLGRNPGRLKILGLALGNALTAMSGSLLAQQTGSANVTSGSGMVVMALAAVIIGTNLFGRIPFVKPTTAVILGMIVYRGVLALALQLRLPTNYLKLLMAVIFTVALVLSRRTKSTKKEGFIHVRRR